ncbi:NADH dehydrogenase ubiquinone iron-sulfur protein 6, mitochondrial [Porphyridium purpureum]|uniref:NADH dehydrogenase ubiquinone iron-sulfur protein 6, mitochondrial n=1 Tax=Porphyridium purpureum TaxID=35688 RepID=A0A5J4Z2H0_PORPP|nr:NADH dehydrogenase ubiquinone iron-sulfur protein 6, mitochondrial [Porphyridium purpureum]|eukprot:POR2946..scf208_2
MANALRIRVALRAWGGVMGQSNGARLALGGFATTRAGQQGWTRFGSSDAPSRFAHLPLGQVPEGTDPSQVKSKWGSNAMDMIQQVAPILVDGNVVVCDGGGDPSVGHPIEFIKLDMPYPAVCKYCGLRYARKNAH